MRSSDSGASRRNRVILFCATIALFFPLVPVVQARPLRHKKPTPFSVALEPFSLALKETDVMAGSNK